MAAGSRAVRRGTTLLLALVLLVGVPSYAHAADDRGRKQSAAQKRELAEQRTAARLAAQRKAAAQAAARRAADWRPKDSTWFNYPLSPSESDRFRIRHQIRSAIQHTPAGQTIRMATFNFDDYLIGDDLVAAHRRGVSVQVLVAKKNTTGDSFQKLARGLAQKRATGAPHPGRSFAKGCNYSCRGTRGLVHTKLYLFSRVGGVHDVSMIGSANLTRFAAVGQWNHLDTVVGKDDFTHLTKVFNQMRRDRPHGSITFTTKKMVAWVYPRTNRNIAKDPMVQSLRRVTCTWKPKNSVHIKRTTIRIAMYAWFDERGNDLARTVRQKWNQGCNVWVIYSVTNGTVLKILRNSKGRGAIPVRRTATFDSVGEVVDYNHSKYVALHGRYGGKGAALVWTGSMNWTALGLTSDELLVRLHGSRVYSSYLRNFNRVWRGPATD